MTEFFDEPDYTYTNEDDGMDFYGYDDGDGNIDWYDEDGELDCTTSNFFDDDEW